VTIRLGITDFFKKSKTTSGIIENNFDDSVIEHFWMTKDDNKNKKSTAKKDPRIETGILRSRIAEKIAKMNNH
jgi:hypothetical protein